tara:strand:- start:70 stop:420 length:351 start_codon:yes stop_codon:yes gene_type:complete
MNYHLLINFIFGGVIVASTSIIGNNFNPVISAIFWSFPYTLIPSIYYIKRSGKSNKYIAEFIKKISYSLVLLFIALTILAHFIGKGDKLILSVIKTIMIWLFFSIIFYYIMKNIIK